MAMANQVLQQDKTEDLANLAETARDMSSQSHLGSKHRKPFDLIAATAVLKRKLQNLDNRLLTQADFRYGEPKWCFNGADATFAMDKGCGTDCYIVSSNVPRSGKC